MDTWGRRNKKQLSFFKRCVTSLFVLLGTDDLDVGAFVRVRLSLVTRVNALPRTSVQQLILNSDIEQELLSDKWRNLGVSTACESVF